MGNFDRGSRFGGRRDFGRRDFGGRGRGGGDREMHKAVCSECGKDCEVPFQPTGSKPVYCSECFEKRNGGSDSRSFRGRDSGRRDFGGGDSSRPQNNAQMEMINTKLDKILSMLAPAPKVTIVEKVAKVEKTVKTEGPERALRVEGKEKPKKETKVKKVASDKKK